MYDLLNTTRLSCTDCGGPKSSLPLAALGGTKTKVLKSKSSLAQLVGFVRNPVEIAGDAIDSWLDGLSKEEREEKQRFEDRKRILYLNLRNATRHDDWNFAATELDKIEGNNDWKMILESPDYDARLVEARLRQLDEARISCDVGRMLFLVRTALTRGLGDMGNLKLYKYSHIGTKDLIERYITSALETLDALLDISQKADCDGLENKHILEQVLSTRQAFGRSALLLSGGGTFGLNHIGVLKAMWEARLLPRIISGSSAGSIVSAVICTRTDEEIPELLANFCGGDLTIFEEKGHDDGILRKVARFLKYGALFDISHLVKAVKELLGEITFQEAYNRTRRILNICVSSASIYELPRLLNYITAPNVLIWSAVAASCSVPLIFSAASLLAKHPKTGESVPWNASPQLLIDGSVDNDIPTIRLAEMFNVNHFIVSQVNPHVVPFLIREEDSIAPEAQQTQSGITAAPRWLHGITHLAKGELLHRMHSMAELGIFPNSLTKAVSVLSQKYSGDINIFPEIAYSDFPRVLSNPTSEFMIDAMLCGERATWPKLSRIRNHCAIELALDEAVQKLRTRIVFSSSQVDLRLGAYARANSDAKKRGTLRGTRGAGKRRKMSQTSEPDPSIVENAKQGNLFQPKDLNHGKAASVHIILNDDSEPPLMFASPGPLSTNSPTKLTADPQPHQDLLSSGAETSYQSTSDSDEESCSSTESPYSPPPPHGPTPWSFTRQLFPFASQPVSPITSHRPFSTFSAAATHDASKTVPNRSQNPSTSLGGRSMSPTHSRSELERTNPSELTYKCLFHHARSKLKGSEAVSASPKQGGKRFSGLGLEIDISGTRGMVLRKKRSE